MDFLKPYSSHLLSLMRVMSGLLLLQYGTAIILGFPVMEVFKNVAVGQWPAWYAGIIEMTFSALLVVGLFTRFSAFILSGLCAFAFFLGHVIPRGVITPALNGGTIPALMCFVYLYIASVGGGDWSIDRMFRGKD